jgi:hypothetical protein
MQTMDRTNAAPLPNFEQALKLKPLDCFPHNSACDTELFGETTFGRQTLLVLELRFLNKA